MVTVVYWTREIQSWGNYKLRQRDTAQVCFSSLTVCPPIGSTLWGERESTAVQDINVPKNHLRAHENADSLAFLSEILISVAGGIHLCNKLPFRFLRSYHRSSQLSFERLMKETPNPVILFSGSHHVLPVDPPWLEQEGGGKHGSRVSSAPLIGTSHFPPSSCPLHSTYFHFTMRKTIWNVAIIQIEPQHVVFTFLIGLWLPAQALSS